MSTPNAPAPDPESAERSRTPLRLRLAEHADGDSLDGGWWPHSRDLTVELADLVDQFPPQCGRIERALFSAPDWESAPRRIAVAAGYVDVEAFLRDDAHLMHLTTVDGSLVRLLVVPPEVTDQQGEEALLAAATSGNAHSASSLLDTAREHPDVDPQDLWNDSGGSWWDPHPVAPSSRRSGRP
ncbi:MULTISPECIES: DUF5994 family protein [unclassified Nocardioides]|uniref:DUF5994 family protein n=1 Tax=unclassified Nocardioides TaxID=2615069 RepID=UPI00360DA2F8